MCVVNAFFLTLYLDLQLQGFWFRQLRRDLSLFFSCIWVSEKNKKVKQIYSQDKTVYTLLLNKGLLYQKVAKRFQVLLQLQINWKDLKTFLKTIFYTTPWQNIVHAKWLQKQLFNITKGKDKRGWAFKAAWPSGKAEDCKSSIPSSNPGVAYCVYNRS